MSRLPARLQPLWPAVKLGHRYGARVVGAVGRRTGGPSRGLPRHACDSARETSAVEPTTCRVHEAGPPLTVRRPMPTGYPSGHPYFAARLEHTVPERFVLDLTDGLLLGRHAAVVTAGGRLDMETSHYYDIAGWKEHPVFWNPRPSEPTVVDGTAVLLAARGTADNYYHFMMDSLPRLGILDRAIGGFNAAEGPDAWVVNRHTRYQREFLELLGIDAGLTVEPGPGFALRARRLLVPSLPNVSNLASPETTTWLREHLPPRDPGSCPERIYITRGSTPNTRRVVEEDAVRDLLARRGFTVIDPGTLSVQEQIDHFAAARVVVAPHGAALANLNFCRPGVRLLELFAPGYINGGYWSITTNIPDARYAYLIGAGTGPRDPRTPGRGLMHDIEVRPEQVAEAVDALIAA